MRHPQLVICEGDGRLAARLRPLVEGRGWSLREPARAATCLRLLARGGPNVLLLRTGRDLERELSLLDEVTRRFPETRTVVVTETDHARLFGLAWELGAAYVLTAAAARERLGELVAALLEGGKPR